MYIMPINDPMVQYIFCHSSLFNTMVVGIDTISLNFIQGVLALSIIPNVFPLFIQFYTNL